MNDNTLAAQHQARAQAILDQMTLDEKLAQIVGFWDKGDGEAVAPLQGEFQEAPRLPVLHAMDLGTLPVRMEHAPWTPLNGPPGCGTNSAASSRKPAWEFRCSSTRNA